MTATKYNRAVKAQRAFFSSRTEAPIFVGNLMIVYSVEEGRVLVAQPGALKGDKLPPPRKP